MTETQRDAVKALSAQHGGYLTVTQLIEEARNPHSTLHGLFDWNLPQPWMTTAREIIQSIKFVPASEKGIDPDDIRRTAPFYAHDPDKGAGCYVAVTVLQDNRDLAMRTIRKTIQHTVDTIAYARALSVVLGLTGEIDSAFAHEGVLKSTTV